MTAAPKDLAIEQGSTFTLGFNWHKEGPLDTSGNPTPGDPYDLTGCTARMQIRRKQGDPPLLTATSDPPTSQAAIDAGAGRIALGGTTGRIDITLTDEDTDLLSARSSVYDLEIEWPLPSRQVTAAVTTGSAVITASAADLFTTGDINYTVSGTAIPASTVIIAVAADGTTATLSAAATADDPAAALTLTSSLRPRVDRLLQGTVTVDPNVTQVDGQDPVVT
jgi:hypothetical protein